MNLEWVEQEQQVTLELYLILGIKLECVLDHLLVQLVQLLLVYILMQLVVIQEIL